MIPIDGEKLTKPSEEDIRGGWTLNTDIMSEIEKIGDDVSEEFNPCLEGVEVVLISLLKCKSLQFKPGTIVIQREEGYELRPCITCIWSKLTFCDEYRCDDCPPEGVHKSKCTQHCKDCKYLPPCYEHIAPEEIEAAYIVGGGEK